VFRPSYCYMHISFTYDYVIKFVSDFRQIVVFSGDSGFLHQ
jgi:hypothetical protein